MRILRTNRKKKRAAGFMIPLPFAVVMLASVFSLGYLGLEIRCETLGEQLKELEARRKEAHDKRLYEEARWANMKSPGQIEKVLRRHRLTMIWPRQDQIVFVGESEPLDVAP